MGLWTCYWWNVSLIIFHIMQIGLKKFRSLNCFLNSNSKYDFLRGKKYKESQFFIFRSAPCAIFPWCWMDSMKENKKFCQSCNIAIEEYDQKKSGPIQGLIDFKPKWKLPKFK